MANKPTIILSINIATDDKKPNFDITQFFQDKLSESSFKGFKSTGMKFRLDKSKREKKKIEKFCNEKLDAQTHALLINIQDNNYGFACGVMGLSMSGPVYSFNLAFKTEGELQAHFLYQNIEDTTGSIMLGGDYCGLKPSTLQTFINYMVIANN